MKDAQLTFVEVEDRAALSKVQMPTAWDDVLSISLRAIDFERGLLFALSPVSGNSLAAVDLEGSLPAMKGKVGLAESIMAEFISEYLSQDDSRVALIQAMEYEGDPCIERTETPWVLLSRRSERRALCLYQHRSNATLETMSVALLEKRDLTFIIVLSSLPDVATTIVEQEELEEPAVKHIVRNTEFLIVDCFDGESYLLWALPESARRAGLKVD